MAHRHQPLSHSLQEYARGIAGGLLFSFPLLYTMEVWWAGYVVHPFHLILFIVITYLLLLGYNRYAGMHSGTSWRDILMDSVEEMGIGLVLSFLVLLLLRRIELYEMDVDELLGKVIIEAMAVSIGVSVGTAQLGVEPEAAVQEEKDHSISGRSKLLGLVVLSLCGAILVAANVAPTEEILILAIEASEGHLLIMLLVSLLLSVLVVFFSNFKGTARNKMPHPVLEISFETCISYVVALSASAFLLWSFGRFAQASFDSCLAQTMVLGVIAALGASAGRLLIK